MKWNTKHNTNDLQNTYISVNHNIVQYQAFNSIKRYFKIMYIHGENKITQWFKGYISLSLANTWFGDIESFISEFNTAFLLLVQPFIYTHSVMYNSVILDMPHNLILPYTIFLNEYIFAVIYVFSFYFFPSLHTNPISQSYTTWTYSKSCQIFFMLRISDQYAFDFTIPSL